MDYKVITLETDILIIGGGAAGCYSAITLGENSKAKVIVVDKANIKRSGCLAAGVNALNAYINKGETEDSYLDYVRKEAEGIIREDLVYTIAKRLNIVTKKINDLGVPILKDENGDYVPRGKRSIKINGENIKPILAKAVLSKENIRIINKVNIADYLIDNNRVVGAVGFSVDREEFYIINAKAVICTTGGAAGLYKPNNPGFSQHKMWYSPFNTGAGYAMGIRAGAEMTTFEMRFVALRCKNTIAPTGTIAQGIKAKQINSNSEEYVRSYGKPTTINRLYSTVEENKKGNGPCYLKTVGIEKEVEEDLFRAYLNMAPAQTLKWIDYGRGPMEENVEIEGTEPYIVGGHSASGYWIGKDRSTTIKGLFAAGDVAGGCPKKYVTGCFVEGEIAAYSALEYVKNKNNYNYNINLGQEKINELKEYLEREEGMYTVSNLEEEMQKAMDEYAGGISTSYEYSLASLDIADKKIDKLKDMTKLLKANDFHELLFIQELIDRLYVCKTLIVHLKERKETRWRIYGENSDFPEANPSYKKYINTVLEQGNIKVIYRDIIGKDDIYEHHYK